MLAVWQSARRKDLTNRALLQMFALLLAQRPTGACRCSSPTSLWAQKLLFRNCAMPALFARDRAGRKFATPLLSILVAERWPTKERDRALRALKRGRTNPLKNAHGLVRKRVSTGWCSIRCHAWGRVLAVAVAIRWYFGIDSRAGSAAYGIRGISA